MGTVNNPLTGEFKNLATRFEEAFDRYPAHLAMRWRDRRSEVFYEMNYRQLREKVHALAIGLLDLGIEKGERVGLVADVAPEWTIADIAVQLLGAVDVPRGTDSTEQDLGYIINHCEARFVFVHYPSEIDKIDRGLAGLGNHKISKYIVLNNHVSQRHADRAVSLFDVIERGMDLIDGNTPLAAELEKRRQETGPEDLAAIVYTSGTTGVPKGVMLNHANFSFQLDLAPQMFGIQEHERGINLLPPWHIFGRTVEYNLLLGGASITYTDIRHLAQDMVDIKPTFFPAVPRIWENFYNKMLILLKKTGKEEDFYKYKKYAVAYARAKNRFFGRERLFAKRGAITELWLRIAALGKMVWYYFPKRLGHILIFRKLVDATGGEIRVPVSGGSALPGHIDEFFEAIGIQIMEGYGMTETTAVISLRVPGHIVPGTVGRPIAGIEVRLMDDTGQDVTGLPNARGTLHTKGPHVMQGYYRMPEKTEETIDSDGWLNTGDVAMITVGGDIAIVGRSKDTIVLANGENIEPTPIEEKLKESDYIDHVMVVGQDQKHLAALIVPNEDELGDYARQVGVRSTSLAVWAEEPRVQDMFKKEVTKLISRENGFKSFEHIGDFRILTKRFEKGDELNNTMKIRRHIVTEKYEDLITELYAPKEPAGKAGRK